MFHALGGVPETEAGLALWRMALLAHADKPTQAVLLSGAAWPEVLAQLGGSEPGRKFLAAWDAFMREHGEAKVLLVDAEFAGVVEKASK